MKMKKSNATTYFADGTTARGIIVERTERIILVPIEIKMAANNPEHKSSVLYAAYKAMYPSYKEIITW